MANFCENCGSPVQNDNRFCANCGAPVNQPEPDVPVAPVTAPPVGRGAATSAATASSTTIAAGAVATQGRTQQTFVPPQPQQESFRSAMQQQPPQPHYGPQNQEQTSFGQQLGQERLSSGYMPMGTPAYGAAGAKYEPDTDLKSMYLRYDNRLNRKRYILRSLALLAVVIVISLLIGFIATALKIRSLSILGTIVSIASAIPSFMLMIRRLHDLDRPTWWCIGCLIPLVNGVLGIYLLFFKGTDGPNQYGPDPLDV